MAFELIGPGMYLREPDENDEPVQPWEEFIAEMRQKIAEAKERQKDAVNC